MNSSETETDTDLLTTAVERGFFKVPRKTPLVDIADAHDISDVEASERLRAELDMALREYLDAFDATATEDAKAGEPAALGLDTVFDALRNARRRQLLRYLNDQNGQVTLSDLAEHIAAIENDTTPELLDSQQRKRVYVGLYQSHLPKLDSMGVLTFDQQRGIIELTPAASQLNEYLYDDTAEAHSSKRYYVECVGVSALVLLLSAITGIVGVIGAISAFVGIAIGVVGLAVFHAYDQV